jgi:hypothetical protein
MALRTSVVYDQNNITMDGLYNARVKAWNSNAMDIIGIAAVHTYVSKVQHWSICEIIQ